MRKLSNGAVGVIAAAVCIFITVLTMDTDAFSMAFNLAVLAVMLVILAFSGLFGFSRTQQTIRGLDGAARKLTGIYQEKGDLEEVTAVGSQIFQVEYLDRKYQEYLAYLRKADSPCDIGDYIGEYEINNYIHRRLIEMVPDILTSLGILGTFLGLVWGLRGFDPVSYEAMTSSVSSLINGIKVEIIGGACLDVYEEEADLFYEDMSGHIVQDDKLVRLMAMPNVIVTSHQAFLTQEALDNIANTTVSNMRKFASGEPSPETEVCYHCSHKDDCRKERHQKCF